MTAHCLCSHPRTGLVTSRPLGGIEDSYAATYVCDLAECHREAFEWVERMSGRTPYYVAEVAS